MTYYVRQIVLSTHPDKVKNKEKVVRRSTFKTCFDNFNTKEKNKILQLIERHLKFTNIFFELINKKIFKIEGEKDTRFLNVINHSRSEWTYNYNKKFFNDLEFNEVSPDDALKIEYNLSIAALATIKPSLLGFSKNFLNLVGMLPLIFSKLTSSNFCGR